jgi:hypothetical protein
MAKKKKRRTTEQFHRQVKDSIQALPYMAEQQKKEGKRIRAFLLRYFSGPMLRVMNRLLDRKRYRGTEGEKLRQTDQMKRHLDQRKAAITHFQSHLQKEQKRRKPMA